MNEKNENYVAVALILALAVGVYIVFNFEMKPVEHTPVLEVHHGHEVTQLEKVTSLKVARQDLEPLTAEIPYGVLDETSYANRRAFHGAPPVIPHPIEMGAFRLDNCLYCHEKGGYVASFKKIAPVTPHPEFVNCQQCHVTQQETELFSGLDWDKVKPPQTDLSALPGGPSPIPHSLQLRENCHSCHGAKASRVELRSPHPDRLHCQQCHVPSQTKQLFDRKAAAWLVEEPLH